MESIQFTIKSQSYTNARYLSKLCGKVISTEFMSNIAQLKVKSKAHHKTIQAELTCNKRIRLHENNKGI